MSSDLYEIVKQQLPFCISKTNYDIGKKYQGKVRDVYEIDNKLLIITTDRISAFDRVLGVIPFKGEILTNISTFWFKKTEDIIKNHIIKQIHPNALFVKKCKILPIEIIIRGYLTGGGWREYSKTGKVSGIELPENLKKDCKLESPIFTPTTKADTGHDESITKDEIIKQNIICEELLNKVESIAYQLFQRGTEIAGNNNLILVDTKYEFGLLDDGSLILADEIHTSDSSRYWFLDTYESLFEEGKEQKMLDKEYLRQWLISKDYMGDGDPPEIPIDVISGVFQKYLSAYETITGEKYPIKTDNIIDSLNKAIENLKSEL